MPLYVPVEHVVLDWSSRVGGGSRFYENPQELAEAVQRVVPEVVAEALSGSPVVDAPRLGAGAETEPMQEARAYALVLEGEVAEAIELLGRVADLTPQYRWEREMVDRAAESRSILQRGEADDLRSRLEGWRLETMSALKVVPE